jgi:hypothetical protein
MKFLLVLVLVVVLSGCTTNGQYDSGKTWTLITVVAIGAVVALQDSNSDPTGMNCHWIVGPNGSTQFCR